MIKQLIQWKSLKGAQRSKTFYFNLTEYEVAGEMELEVLHARFLKFQEEVVNSTTGDDKRDMTPAEIREMLDMVKTIVRYAYGEFRDDSEGGEIWKDAQDPNVWNRFVASGGFDAFIWYLFRDGNRANSFMTNIWPDAYKSGVADALTKEEEVRDDMGLTADVPNIGEEDEVFDIASIGEWAFMDSLGDYSKDYLLKCSEDEFQAIVDHFTEGRNTPYQLLAVGMQRMNQKQESAGE